MTNQKLRNNIRQLVALNPQPPPSPLRAVHPSPHPPPLPWASFILKSLVLLSKTVVFYDKHAFYCIKLVFFLKSKGFA